MMNEEQTLCKACATGNPKHEHNGDLNSCIKGREELIRSMSPEEQLKALVIHERLSCALAEHIWNLSVSRNKTPLEVLAEDGLKLW